MRTATRINLLISLLVCFKLSIATCVVAENIDGNDGQVLCHCGLTLQATVYSIGTPLSAHKVATAPPPGSSGWPSEWERLKNRKIEV